LKKNNFQKNYHFYFRTSLPVIVSVSPAKTSSRRLSPPTILRKTSSSIPSLYNIHTRFFKDLIYKYGTNTISSVTQCVLDLTLIVSVHSALPNLSESNSDYQIKYQQIIDPLKYTDNFIGTKTLNESDILIFYKMIKQNRANIRNAQCKISFLFFLFLKICFFIYSNEKYNFLESIEDIRTSSTDFNQQTSSKSDLN